VRGQAAVRQQDLRNRIQAEVRSALRDLATARALGEAARGETEAAREALEGEQLKERNGASTPFQVLQKEDVVTQAVTREARAAANVRIAIARVWKAVGLLSEQRAP
jgi:outer membrane protein TolC